MLFQTAQFCKLCITYSNLLVDLLSKFFQLQGSMIVLNFGIHSEGQRDSVDG